MSTALRTRAYNLVRQRLLSGRIAPGSRLSELALAKEIGISRAPVREAIAQLVSDGLLERFPGLGAFAKLPNRRELEELFVLRELLECHAAAQAATKATHAHLEKLRACCRELLHVAAEMRVIEPKHHRELANRIIAADYAFHLQIIEIADNRQILRIMRNFHVLADFFGHYARRSVDLGEVARVWREHMSILRALERHDGQSAREWMARQITRSRQLVLANFDEMLADGQASMAASLPPHLRGQL